MILSLGLSYYKEGCKFRWSEEDRVLKYKIKNQKRDTLALHEHLEVVFVTLVVGSPDVSREFRLTSGLPTPTVTENYSMCS